MSHAQTFVNERLGTSNYRKIDPAAVQQLRDELEAAFAIWAIERTFSFRRAAELLGMNRNTLRKIVNKHGVTAVSRGGEE